MSIKLTTYFTGNLKLITNPLNGLRESVYNSFTIVRLLIRYIFLGTIPLLQQQSYPTPSNSAENRYSNLAPPSYEASVFGTNIPQNYDENNKGAELVETDNHSYVPYYPFYKDFSQ